MIEGKTRDGSIDWSVDSEGVALLEREDENDDMHYIFLSVSDLAEILRATGYDVKEPKK